MNSFDSNLELVDIVQGIKDTEDIDTVLLGLVDEVIDGVIRQRGVSNTVSTTEKHLERNVGNKLSHLSESVPGVLIEESHGNIKGGTTPALKGVQVGERMASFLGNTEQVDGTNTSSQK